VLRTWHVLVCSVVYAWTWLAGWFCFLQRRNWGGYTATDMTMVKMRMTCLLPLRHELLAALHPSCCLIASL
jgi:hypothetical protein